MAVDLQVCKGELQNSRILANESGRMAAHATATLERVAAGQKALAAAFLKLVLRWAGLAGASQKQ